MTTTAPLLHFTPGLRRLTKHTAEKLPQTGLADVPVALGADGRGEPQL